MPGPTTLRTSLLPGQFQPAGDSSYARDMLSLLVVIAFLGPNSLVTVTSLRHCCNQCNTFMGVMGSRESCPLCTQLEDMLCLTLTCLQDRINAGGLECLDEIHADMRMTLIICFLEG